MFEKYDLQQVADMFQQLAMISPGNKQQALCSIKQFRQCEWYPGVLLSAINTMGDEYFFISDQKMLFDGDKRNALNAIRYVLETYKDITTCNHRSFSTTDAAHYLFMNLPTLRYHIHTSKRITRSHTNGKNLSFTRRDLWLFQSKHRKGK